jgi:adenine-specific DNA-methyltransferase
MPAGANVLPTASIQQAATIPSTMTAALAGSPQHPPALHRSERPVSFADRLGGWYAGHIDEAHRKARGHYLTPPAIADFMGRLCLDGTRSTVRLLDPAAGAGTLAAAACEALASLEKSPARIELVAYEVDAGLLPVLEASFAHLADWLMARGIELSVRLEHRDFLLTNAGALEGGLFPYEDSFDAVICNPPYFKLPKSDPRAQACLAVVHGQPNVYGLFMAIGAALLREGGRFVYITPRSFTSGPYFQRFRQWFFDHIRPTELHVFESRTEASDEVLQETVITAGDRATAWQCGNGSSVRLSVSAGAADIGQRKSRDLPTTDVLRGDCAHRMLYLPACQEHDRVRELVGNWTATLHTYGWEVSTGPIVAFRAKALLRERGSDKAAPLLWLQHVQPMRVVWPLDTRKLQFVEDGPASDHLLLPNRNYVVLRRFSAKEEKRRLTAAPYLAGQFPVRGRIGLENHLNYVHRPDGRQLSPDEVYGLAALLNSRLMDTWFRIGSGNTQVSATELRAMPLPDIEIIRRIGKRARRGGEEIDAIVQAKLGYVN